MLVAVVIGTTISATGLADEHHGKGTGSHGHEFHKNTIAGFIGVTGEERRERAVTLGIDYERRINELVGIGIGVERAMGDLDFTVLTVPFGFHFGHWKLMIGPGVEFAHGEKEHELVRAGVEYAFDMGGYELAPKFMVDFVDGEAVLIAGVGFVWGF
jgi:hypothetical protein